MRKISIFFIVLVLGANMGLADLIHRFAGGGGGGGGGGSWGGNNLSLQTGNLADLIKKRIGVGTLRSGNPVSPNYQSNVRADAMFGVRAPTQQTLQTPTYIRPLSTPIKSSQGANAMAGARVPTQLQSGGNTGTTSSGGNTGTASPQVTSPTSTTTPVSTPTSATPNLSTLVEEQDPYADIKARLDEMIGFLPTYQSDLEQRIANLVASQQSGIEKTRADQMAKFRIYNQNAEQNKQAAIDRLNLNRTAEEAKLQGQKKKSLRDLSQDLVNQYQAANTYLGTRGSGDSSAADMYGFAIGQLGNRTRGDIMTQNNQLMGDIGTAYQGGVADVETQYQNIMNELDLKKQDLETGVNEQLNQVDTWKNQELANIAKEIQAKKEQLQNAGLELDKETVDYWRNRLDEIQANTQQWQQVIAQWGLERQAQLENAQATLSNSLSGSPQNITTNELNTIPRYMDWARLNNPFAYQG